MGSHSGHSETAVFHDICRDNRKHNAIFFHTCMEQNNTIKIPDESSARTEPPKIHPVHARNAKGNAANMNLIFTICTDSADFQGRSARTDHSPQSEEMMMKIYFEDEDQSALHQTTMTDQAAKICCTHPSPSITFRRRTMYRLSSSTEAAQDT